MRSLSPGAVAAVEERIAHLVERFGPGVQAGVTLREGAEYEEVASTDDAARRCDVVELEAVEGPCVDAMNTISGVLVPSLVDAPWPEWAAAARAEGFVSAAALPALVTSTRVVAVNLYADRPDPWDAGHLVELDELVQDVARAVRGA